MGVEGSQIGSHTHTVKDTPGVSPPDHSSSTTARHITPPPPHRNSRQAPRFPHSWRAKPAWSPGQAPAASVPIDPPPCRLYVQSESQSFVSMTDELELHERHLSFCFRNTLFSRDASWEHLNPQGLFRDIWCKSGMPTSRFLRDQPYRGRWPERDARVGSAQGCPTASSQDPRQALGKNGSGIYEAKSGS